MLKSTFDKLKEFFKAFVLEDSEKANSIKFADMLEYGEGSDDSEEESNGKRKA